MVAFILLPSTVPANPAPPPTTRAAAMIPATSAPLPFFLGGLLAAGATCTLFAPVLFAPFA
ncbi:MAG: hypothetical protein ACLS48_08655 [[Eubacterium] siraeum]